MGGSHPVGVGRGTAEVVGGGVVGAGLVGDNGNGVWARVLTSKRRELGKGRVGRQARRLLRQHGSFALPAKSLLLGEGLLLPAHLAAGDASIGAVAANFRGAFPAGSAQEVEAGAARSCLVGGRLGLGLGCRGADRGVR